MVIEKRHRLRVSSSVAPGDVLLPRHRPRHDSGECGGGKVAKSSKSTSWRRCCSGAVVCTVLVLFTIVVACLLYIFRATGRGWIAFLLGKVEDEVYVEHVEKMFKRKLAIGIFSVPTEKGAARRELIRETWARNQDATFIVGGQWEVIEQEFARTQDLIWVDFREVYYDKEKMESILPLKSLVFVNAYTKYAKFFRYFFKTDDDSMLDAASLNEVLDNEEKEGKAVDYWGTCWPQSPVIRDPSHKWFIPRSTFKRDMYPLYCVGAGYLLSRKAVVCINKHMENLLPFMPMEDVAVGILVEMCKMRPHKLRSVDVFNYFDWTEPIWLSNSRPGLLTDALEPSMNGYQSTVLFHKVTTEAQMRFLWNRGVPMRKSKPANILAALVAAKRGKLSAAQAILHGHGRGELVHVTSTKLASNTARQRKEVNLQFEQVSSDRSAAAPMQSNIQTDASKIDNTTPNKREDVPKLQKFEGQKLDPLPLQLAQTTRNRLLITSAGDNSNVRQWVFDNSLSRSFDVVIMYYGKREAFEYATFVDHVWKMKGTKFPNLLRVVQAFPKWFKAYKSVAVFDDDIQITPRGIEDLFAIREATRHTIIAPALVGTHITYPTQYRRRPYARLREVEMVEMNAPVFETIFLKGFLSDVFDLTIKGWGTDIWYSQYCKDVLGSSCLQGITDAVWAVNPATRNGGEREITKIMSARQLEEAWSEMARRHGLESKPPRSSYVFESKDLHLEKLGLQLECIEDSTGDRSAPVPHKVTSALRRFDREVLKNALDLDCLRTFSPYKVFNYKGRAHYSSPGSLISEPCRWHPHLALWTSARTQDPGTARALANGRLTSVPTFYISSGNGEEEEEEEEVDVGMSPSDIRILSTNLVKIGGINPMDGRSMRRVVSRWSATSIRNRAKQSSASRIAARKLIGHLRAILMAYESQAEYALIVEDSVSASLSPFWPISIEDFASALPNDWQAAQLMHHAGNNVSPDVLAKVNFRQSAEDLQVPDLSRPFQRGSRPGSGAYLIHRRGMEAIMDELYDEDKFDLEDLADSCADLSVDTCFLGFGQTGPTRTLKEVYRALPPLFTARDVDTNAGLQLFCEDVRSVLHFRQAMCEGKRASDATRAFYTRSTAKI